MLSLSTVSLIFGAALLVLYLPLILAPERVRKILAWFPRSRWPGRILTAVDLIWAAWLLQQMPLGRFDQYKPLLYVLTPVTFVLIVVFMDDLLSARALGGLLVLIPAPLLIVARWHESPFRLVIVFLAYGMAVKGILLILGPYRLRKWSARLLDSDPKCRLWGGIGLAVGGLLVVLGVGVF